MWFFLSGTKARNLYADELLLLVFSFDRIWGSRSDIHGKRAYSAVASVSESQVITHGSTNTPIRWDLPNDSLLGRNNVHFPNEYQLYRHHPILSRLCLRSLALGIMMWWRIVWLVEIYPGTAFPWCMQQKYLARSQLWWTGASGGTGASNCEISAWLRVHHFVLFFSFGVWGFLP